MITIYKMKKKKITKGRYKQIYNIIFVFKKYRIVIENKAR